MKKSLIAMSIYSLSLGLGACDKSSSSEAPPPPTPTVTENAVAATDGTVLPSAGGAAEPTINDTSGESPENAELPPGELQNVITLNSSFLEYSRMQYDCGDIAAPLDTSGVEANLKGAKRFETLAATIPAKDQAMVKITLEDEGVSCTYRAIFAVNKAFTEVTFQSSQALDAESVTACSLGKQVIDEGFGTNAVAFDYDKKFIRWVALHVPSAMQKTPVCGNGKLRAVFAGATL